MQRVESIPHCDRPYDNMCISVKNNNNATCGSPISRGNNVIRLVSLGEYWKRVKQYKERDYDTTVFFPLQISSRIAFNVYGARSMCFSCQISRAALTIWLDICSRLPLSAFFLLFCMRAQALIIENSNI